MKHTTSGTLVVIAMSAVAVGIVAFSRYAAIEAVYPIERASLFVRRSAWPRIKGAFNGPGLAAENARLKREVAMLAMMPVEVERLERENAALRRSLEYAARDPKKWIVAPVLAGHCGAAGVGHVVRVGRGTSDGVADDAIVACPDGLVGQVTSVTAHTAEITLLTDRTLKVACSVMLGNGRTASGILEGGDDELSLTHINGLSTDVPQAQIVTSGRGGVFPAGFPVGRLVGASVTETGDWIGKVRPSVDFDNLEDVFIRGER